MLKKKYFKPECVVTELNQSDRIAACGWSEMNVLIEPTDICTDSTYQDLGLTACTYTDLATS